MIQSMTGFGRGSAKSLTKNITVEIKSLNSKQLDLSMKLPAYFRELEVVMRNSISEKLLRGKIDVSAIVENISTETPASLNGEVIGLYKKQIEDLAASLSIDTPKEWFSTLLRLPDALKIEYKTSDKNDEEAFRMACMNAVEALIEFRITEGEKLYQFFCTKIETIGSLLDSILPFEQQRIPKIKARIEEQLSKLESVDYDRCRLEQELIYYIEKLDVTEEITRLRSHMKYFLETLNLPLQSGQGKKLGFIAQEMGREINTLGSKSNDAEMQMIVVKMKDELEQIKEQVLNVL